ncbi:hypothetical protein QBC34DRAFT_399120, partial [Podospora aff. communis PSN243]
MRATTLLIGWLSAIRMGTVWAAPHLPSNLTGSRLLGPERQGRLPRAWLGGCFFAAGWNWHGRCRGDFEMAV